MAAHLARLFYRMLTNGQEWVDRGTQEHEERRLEREKQFLHRKAASLGYRLERPHSANTKLPAICRASGSLLGTPWLLSGSRS